VVFQDVLKDMVVFQKVSRVIDIGISLSVSRSVRKNSPATNVPQKVSARVSIVVFTSVCLETVVFIDVCFDSCVSLFVCLSAGTAVFLCTSLKVNHSVVNVVLQDVTKLVDSRVLKVVVVLRLAPTAVLNDVVVFRVVVLDADAEVVIVVVRVVGNVVTHSVVNVVVVFCVELVLVCLLVCLFVENSFTLLKPNRIIIENHQCN